MIAALLAWAVRGAFLKPVFLTMITVRYHLLVENQPIDEGWDARLSALTGKFDELNAASRRLGDGDGAGGHPDGAGARLSGRADRRASVHGRTPLGSRRPGPPSGRQGRGR